jgi:hypothetical protein
VFQNRVLRRILGSQKYKIIGSWIKLHNAELHNLYPSENIIRMMKSRKMRGAGPVARMERNRNEYRVFVGKPEGQRSLERPIHR